MNSTLKSLLFWMVLVVVGVLIWNFSTKFQRQERTASFSEFMSWVDAGTPATYLSVQLDLARRTGWQRAGVTVGDGAVLDDVVVRPGATIGAGAIVQRSAIGRDAVIGAGARVADCIVGDGARIGAGARLDGLCVIGDGVEVAAGAELHGRLVPAPTD